MSSGKTPPPFAAEGVEGEGFPPHPPTSSHRPGVLPGGCGAGEEVIRRAVVETARLLLPRPFVRGVERCDSYVRWCCPS
jgi:hypothetical protein